MAINKVPIKGSTVTITAKGGAKTSAEVECIKGDFEIDWGQYESQEVVCHKSGTTYDKSSYQKFGQTTLDSWFTGDKTDAFQILAFQALNNEGDFDDSVAGGDRHFTVKIAFVDQDSTVIEFEALMLSAKSNFAVQGYLDAKWTLQQTSRPIIS